MSPQVQVGLGNTAEADLRLPRPPGVIRRFWARHPVLADSLIVAVAVLLGIPSVAISATYAPRTAWEVVLCVLLMLATSAALLWRRRHPLAVFVISLAPLVMLHFDFATAAIGVAPLVALYSIAVYVSSRAAMWSLGAAVVGVSSVASFWWLVGEIAFEEAASTVVGLLMGLLIGALFGLNVGGRKRYVEELIERSRQLLIERDQQAQLAAAAERTRIAREMHDIVSHSLAVVVTLAEGAHATDDPQRSRQATRAIADTARDALQQMRVMLGVLRDDSESFAAEDLRKPLLELTPDEVVDNARAAGVPATLTVLGTPVGNDLQRLAVLRIVQEGLTNAMRYASQSSFVRARIDYSGSQITVSVHNDGVTDAAPASRGSGVGLQGLAERVGALGGEFEAGPAGGGQWRVHAVIPKERDER